MEFELLVLVALVMIVEVKVRIVRTNIVEARETFLDIYIERFYGFPTNAMSTP